MSEQRIFKRDLGVAKSVLVTSVRESVHMEQLGWHSVETGFTVFPRANTVLVTMA